MAARSRRFTFRGAYTTRRDAQEKLRTLPDDNRNFIRRRKIHGALRYLVIREVRNA